MEVTRKKEGLTYTSYAASMPEIALMREVVAVLQGGAKFIDSQWDKIGHGSFRLLRRRIAESYYCYSQAELIYSWVFIIAS